jgi:azurin
VSATVAMQSRRTPSSFSRRALFALPLLAGPLAFTLGRSRAGTAPGPLVELKIASDGDFLAFTPSELSCPAGAKVRLSFHHAGKRVMQQHNWVLVVPGATSAIEQAAMAAGAARGWLPREDKRILAATPMCNPGETETVEFVAPSAGNYPFICSYPGHGAEMHGVLHVTAPGSPSSSPTDSRRKAS